MNADRDYSWQGGSHCLSVTSGKSLAMAFSHQNLTEDECKARLLCKEQNKRETFWHRDHEAALIASWKAIQQLDRS